MIPKHLEEYLREIVYGGVDGIITTFAVVAGFAGAQQTDSELMHSIPIVTVLLFGLANLFADGLSMAMGNFLSSKADAEGFIKLRSQTLERMKVDKHTEIAETEQMFLRHGYSEQSAACLAKELSNHADTWVEVKMLLEQQEANPLHSSPVGMALATLFSFVFFGAVPLLPYIFFQSSVDVFGLAIIGTVVALSVLGGLRHVVTGISLPRALIETVGLGSLAALTAYAVGLFFR